jgi:hypothetical protein
MHVTALTFLRPYSGDGSRITVHNADVSWSTFGTQSGQENSIPSPHLSYQGWERWKSTETLQSLCFKRTTGRNIPDFLENYD